MDSNRSKAIAELSAALSALERGEAPAPFVGGYGIQSRLFELSWSDPALEIDFRLPWGMALDDDDSRRARAAEIGAAIRLALLLLQAPAAETGGRTTIAADSRGVSYAVFAPDGALEDSGDDWAPLVRRLGASMPPSSAATVIWP